MPTCCVRHLLQDLLRGQAQLHAGLWGWWRDGCRREAAAFTAGYDKSACQKLIVYYRLHWLHCINTYMSWMWTFGFTGNKSLREGACGLAEKLPIWLGKHRMTQQQSEGRCTHVEYITVKPKERMQVRTEHWKKKSRRFGASLFRWWGVIRSLGKHRKCICGTWCGVTSEAEKRQWKLMVMVLITGRR